MLCFSLAVLHPLPHLPLKENNSPCCELLLLRTPPRGDYSSPCLPLKSCFISLAHLVSTPLQNSPDGRGTCGQPGRERCRRRKRLRARAAGGLGWVRVSAAPRLGLLERGCQAGWSIPGDGDVAACLGTCACDSIKTSPWNNCTNVLFTFILSILSKYCCIFSWTCWRNSVHLVAHDAPARSLKVIPASLWRGAQPTGTAPSWRWVWWGWGGQGGFSWAHSKGQAQLRGAGELGCWGEVQTGLGGAGQPWGAAAVVAARGRGAPASSAGSGSDRSVASPSRLPPHSKHTPRHHHSSSSLV